MAKTNKLVIVGCAGVGGPAAMMASDIDKGRREFLFTMCDPLYLD